MRGAELAEIDGNVSAGLTAATSMAVCKAGAAVAGLPLYHYIAQVAQRQTDQFVMPIPFMAVLSGGKRSENILPAQDILACPNSALTFAEGHELVSELLAVLGNTLGDIEGMEPEETDVGSWAPQEEDITASVKLAYEAIQDAGIDGRLTLGMHVAPSSGFFTGDEKYDLCKLLRYPELLLAIPTGLTSMIDSFSSKRATENITPRVLPRRFELQGSRAAGRVACGQSLLPVPETFRAFPAGVLLWDFRLS
jgi:enolase